MAVEDEVERREAGYEFRGSAGSALGCARVLRRLRGTGALAVYGSGESLHVDHQQAWVPLRTRAPWFAWQPGLNVALSSKFVAVVFAPRHAADCLRHEFRSSAPTLRRGVRFERPIDANICRPATSFRRVRCTVRFSRCNPRFNIVFAYSILPPAARCLSPSHGASSASCDRPSQGSVDPHRFAVPFMDSDVHRVAVITGSKDCTLG